MADLQGFRTSLPLMSGTALAGPKVARKVQRAYPGPLSGVPAFTRRSVNALVKRFYNGDLGTAEGMLQATCVSVGRRLTCGGSANGLIIPVDMLL